MKLELTEDQALVLFDLLQAYEGQSNDRFLVLREAAERNSLWALAAALENVLVPPLRADYAKAIAGARVRVEAEGGSW